MLKKIYLILTGLLFSVSVLANDVDIVNVVLTKQTGTWRADVTLNHADTGWEHYADAWRLVDAKGAEIGKRTLYHPHVSEQPFTRSLGNLHIGDNQKIIYVEAHDKVHGWSANKVKIDMAQPSGDKYQLRSR